MKNNKKDNLEHHLMDFNRKLMQLHQRYQADEFTTEEWLILKKELQDEYGVHSTGKDYVNFCKWMRLTGLSNHGKCNIKHDRNRRIVGRKKMVKMKKQKEFDKADKKLQDDRT